MPPCAPLETGNEGERKVGQRPHVEVDHGELLGAVERGGVADKAKAGIVDDHLRFEPAAGERIGNGFRRIGSRDVHAQNGGARPSLCRNGVGERGKRLLAACDQNEFVTVGGKFVRQRRADPRRRAGDQRDGTPRLAHVCSASRRLATR